MAVENPTAELLLDDLKARKVAMRYQLTFFGTLRLLIDAKRAGLVAAVGPLLTQKAANGFHLSPRLLTLVLREAGENE